MELAAALVTQLCDRFLDRERRTISTRRGHRVEAVRSDQDVGLDRDVFVSDRVVAASVEPFVVVLDVPRDFAREMERAEKPRRKTRMAANRGELLLGQSADFGEGR